MILLQLIIGTLFGFILAILFHLLYESTMAYMDDTIKYYKKVFYLYVTRVFSIVVIVAIPLSILVHEKMLETRYVQEYKLVKQTIEESVDSYNISDLARLNLTQDVLFENRKLARKQSDCKRWYGFAIDKDVLYLKPIKLK